MKHIMLKLILYTFLLIILACCANTNNDNRIASGDDTNPNITKISHTSKIEQSFANKAKADVIKRDEVTSVRGINTDKELMLAIKVTQLNQFNEQDIEKKIKKTLEDKYSNVTIDISSDQKIFLELDKIEQLIQDNKISKDELNKKYQEVKKLLNEQA